MKFDHKFANEAYKKIKSGNFKVFNELYVKRLNGQLEINCELSSNPYKKIVVRTNKYGGVSYAMYFEAGKMRPATESEIQMVENRFKTAIYMQDHQNEDPPIWLNPASA